jgi:transcriptional regulator with XRE-family HTH domain
MAVSHGELIRRAREELGWSIAALARAAGVDRPMVSRIERGQMTGSLETVTALFRALSLDMNLLLKAPLPDELSLSDAPTEIDPTPCA